MPKHLTNFTFKSLLSCIWNTLHVNKLVQLIFLQPTHKSTLPLCVYVLYECFYIRRY